MRTSSPKNIEIDWRDSRPFAVQIHSFSRCDLANFQQFFSVGYGTFLIGAPVLATPPDADQ